MAFLYGVIGALLAGGLAAAGFFVGWKAYPRLHPNKMPEPSEEMMKELKEQQEAVHQLFNYTTEDAYGMNRNPLEDLTGD